MRLLSAAVVGLALIAWAAAQERPQETPSWAPKLEPARYPPGHRPHTKLSELLARHKGQPDWRETIVNDDYFKAEYISMAPGTKVSPRFHPDTREWWIVMDGQIRFEIEGQDSFVASKGSMVQVPFQTIYSMEAIGDKPALRFEVNPAKGKTLYPSSVKPPEAPGVQWIPVLLNRKPQPYGYNNKPHINLYELVKDPAYKGSRFVHDDRGVANVIYGLEKNLPPLNPNQKGHYHPECAEFWLIMMGKIRYPVEKVGTIIAEEGDVVYVPPFTFHAPRFYGDAPACRLAMNGYPNISHLREAH
jgi:mannose-6-phosphate isomerase-like protein (cupin superfamily)